MLARCIPNLVVSCMVMFPNLAHAWSHKGHQIVGELADHSLNAVAAAQVRELIGMPLSDAARWADCVKDVRFVAGTPVYQPQQQYRAACQVFESSARKARMEAYVGRNTRNCPRAPGDEDCHNQYHYTNVNYTRQTYSQLVGTSEHDIVQAIKAAISVLQGSPAPSPFSIDDKQDALLLLAHLIGDMHQPLHVGSIYLDSDGTPINPDAGNYDRQTTTRGGNFLRTGDSNLHRIWDTIPSGLNPGSLPASMAQNARSVPIPSTPIDQWVTGWANETLQKSGIAFAAIRLGKRTSGSWKVTFTDKGSYDRDRTALQREQLELAGGRLAQVLNAIWPSPSGTAVTSTPNPPQAACHEMLRIGAWNIQWLGNAIRGNRPAQTADNLASYIAAAQVDVLALSEISANTSLTGLRKNKQLSQAFAQLNSQGARWEYLLFPKRQGARDPDDQWTGLAWDQRKVTLVGGPWPLGIAIDQARESAISHDIQSDGTTVIWSRWPTGIKLSAGTGKSDFLVIPIHMKSNIGGSATQQARAYEAETLTTALANLAPEQADSDAIVLGDSNMLSTGEPGSQEFLRSGFKDCNSRDLGTHFSQSAPFDRIFLKREQPETADACPTSGNGTGLLDFKVVRPGEWRPGTSISQFRKLLSDHQLVKTTVCIGPDDD